MSKFIKRLARKINFYINYLLANSIFKRRVESGNNTFKMMDDVTLVDKITNDCMSFSRFGDGELSLILDSKFNLNFQSNCAELQKQLRQILNSNIPNLIIGINASFNNSDNYSKKTQKYFRTFNYMYREKYKKIIPNDKIYGNSSITRFYMDYNHRDIAAAYSRLNNLKRIWNNKKILIVEGVYSKLGVGNDLFSNTKSIRRILVPSVDAFSKKAEIVNEIRSNIISGEIVLLAVGPTATILAYELASAGIQAVDLGHIDIEYEWLKMRANKRVNIKGKYVNEAKGKKIIESNDIDCEYNNSIISIIQ